MSSLPVLIAHLVSDLQIALSELFARAIRTDAVVSAHVFLCPGESIKRLTPMFFWYVGFCSFMEADR